MVQSPSNDEPTTPIRTFGIGSWDPIRLRRDVERRTMTLLTSAVIDAGGLQHLVSLLIHRGYRVVGPTVSDNAIVLAELTSADELPTGWGLTSVPGTIGCADATTTPCSAIRRAAVVEAVPASTSSAIVVVRWHRARRSADVCVDATTAPKYLPCFHDATPKKPKSIRRETMSRQPRTNWAGRCPSETYGTYSSSRGSHRVGTRSPAAA